MAEFTDGTGGTYFHNSDDLTGGLKNLTAEPEYIYLLQFSLENGKQDGTYHALKVTVDQNIWSCFSFSKRDCLYSRRPAILRDSIRLYDIRVQIHTFAHRRRA